MKVVEIFQSIDGEVNHFSQGRISTFVRFAGCNLNCRYCDTPKAKDIEKGNYKEMSIEEILIEIRELGGDKITLTGGEPLLQEEIFELMGKLPYVSVETNGSIEIPPFWLVKRNISWIIDYKLEYYLSMIEENYRYLTNKDWVKFPVRNTGEILQAIKVRDKLLQKFPSCSAQFAISPIIIDRKTMKGEIKNLINYLIEIKEFDFVVNLQLHKFINIQ